MALFTLRAADEVRASQFGGGEGEPDADMVTIAQLTSNICGLTINFTAH